MRAARPRFFDRFERNVWLTLPLFAIAALLLVVSFTVSGQIEDFISDNPDTAPALARSGFTSTHLPLAARIAAGVLSAFAGFGLIRKRFGLTSLRAGYFGVVVLVLLYTFSALRLTLGISTDKGRVEGDLLEGGMLVVWLFKILGMPLLLGVVAVAANLGTFLQKTIVCYGGGSNSGEAIGDRIFEWVKRKVWTPKSRSITLSVAAHLAVLFLPLLWQLTETVKPYLVPKGSGVSDPGGGGKKKQTAKKDESKAQKEQTKTTVKVTRQARNLKGLIFSPLAGRDAGAALAQDKRIAALTELSEDRYNTDSDMEGPRRGNGKQKGGLGAGGKGNGGWPNGSPSGVIRFIRMEYQCEGWDDGMDFSHADTNLMDEFQRRYPELKVQSKYEHHPIRLLKRYPKGNAPPFVFIKGEKGFAPIPAADANVLREYLLNGGMLFADAGSEPWGRCFEQMMQQVFPDKPLLVIPHDDPIFQQPFSFPNGAPPLWHHAGWEAKGVKHEGRWCVFYHPGDISDAWKDGNDGLDKDKADAAFEMGFNVLCYAINHYMELQAKLGH